MKKDVLIISIIALSATGAIARAEDSLRFGRFGKVFLYREKSQPPHVVLFVSGDGGWNLGVVDMARELAALDALVVGIDIIHYLKQVQLLVFLGPSATAQFEFHLTNWLGGSEQQSKFLVQPEIEKLKGMKMLCFYGDEEDDSLCQKLDPSLAKIVERKGGHRLGGNYALVAEEILSEVR